jgi:hypothetical protein
VTEAAHRTPSDSLVVGWVELREGRWEDARRVFSRALGTEESPEGLEGLSSS